MWNPINFEGLFAIILSLTIPIVAIICGAIVSMRKKNRETELRKAIIENNVTNPESIKLLIEEQEKKQSNKFVMLRWGCILLGGGIGAAIPAWFGINPPNLYFWLPVVAGMGCGMLIAFLIEYKLGKKMEPPTSEPQN
ncbi:MAG: hypothetical protein K6C10_10395 [Prevotella sp.]|nr:hypothetical protein [Prevotella sp.]